MRKIWYFITVLSFIFSCNKESVDESFDMPPQTLIDKYHNIIGEWNTENQTIDNIGGGSSVRPDHKGLTIFPDLKYHVVLPDQSIEIGTILIDEQNEKILKIRFLPDNYLSKVFEWPKYRIDIITDDLITIYTVGIADGGEQYNYSRIQ